MNNSNNDNTPLAFRIEHILRENPFFEDFTDAELDFFSQHMSLRSFPERSVIFNKGEIGSFLFFVVEGEIEVRLESSDYKQIIVSTFQRGACAGEMSIIDDFPRSATLVTSRPSELLIISKSRVKAICDENPRLGLKFITGITKSLSLKLREISGRYADLA
ncbi:MAG: cyclic nucleotide-binding domain-containing protein [Desulfobulbaceae bacterium]|nr:cyclic nucleotide-binding domain-containing protein [Desulfobulbaceae bacterium]HIJ77955.1 cyclic nucleotide-binding domain-containing protein [Deltaproteobacteria bacterium]